jgi:hypothetical protein
MNSREPEGNNQTDPTGTAMKDCGSKDGFGLLASGSSRLWDVEIDESLSRDNEWFAEIEGPATYITFRLKDLTVVPEVIGFLGRHLDKQPVAPITPEQQEVALGQFAQGNKVSLVWDNEDFVRCFLVVEAKDWSHFRISLYEDDIKMLREAFEQVQSDLAESLPE